VFFLLAVPCPVVEMHFSLTMAAPRSDLIKFVNDSPFHFQFCFFCDRVNIVRFAMRLQALLSAVVRRLISRVPNVLR